MRALIAVALLSLAGTSAAENVCPVYVNSGIIPIETPGERAPRVTVAVPVPQGAVSILSWQPGLEGPRAAQVRVGMRLRLNGRLVNHWAYREVQQAQPVHWGGPIAVRDTDTVVVVVALSNEGTGPEWARTNAWINFGLGPNVPCGDVVVLPPGEEIPEDDNF